MKSTAAAVTISQQQWQKQQVDYAILEQAK